MKSLARLLYALAIVVSLVIVFIYVFGGLPLNSAVLLSMGFLIFVSYRIGREVFK